MHVTAPPSMIITSRRCMTRPEVVLQWRLCLGEALSHVAWVTLSASRILLFISNTDPENSPEYSEFLYLYGNHRSRC